MKWGTDPLGVVLAEVRDLGPVSVADIVLNTDIPERTVRRCLADLERTELVESDNYQRRARVWLPIFRQR